MTVLCFKDLPNGSRCLREVGHQGVHTDRVYTCANCGKIRVGTPASYFVGYPRCFFCTKFEEESELIRQADEMTLEQDEMERLDQKLRLRPSQIRSDDD